MATITSTATGGNLSVAGSWTGGVAPVNGDVIVVANGATINVDTNITLGNNTAAVGAGFTINGSSSTSFGTLIVNAGVTLTLRGFDTTTNLFGKINRYGVFAPAPGASIALDSASDAQSLISNLGIITSTGTSGTRITWSGAVGNRTWGTSATYSTGSVASGWYDQDALTICYPLGDPTQNTPWISNAAGTGLGSFGDSSLSFSSISPTGILATEVSTLAAVNSAGKFYVDYLLGVVYWYQAAGGVFSFTQTYKKLTFFGGTIVSTANTTYNEAVFDYCDFSYMGELVNSDTYVLSFNNKQSDAASGSTRRKARVTNSTFTYCKRSIGLKNLTGTAADPVLVTGNSFTGYNGDNTGYGFCITIFRAANTYLYIQGNVFRGYGVTFTYNASSTTLQSNCLIRGNVFQSTAIFAGNALSTALAPNTSIDQNFQFGFGASNDTRSIQYFGGQSSNPAIIADNVIWRAMRVVNYVSYLSILRNVTGHCYHHVLSGPTGDNDVQVTAISVAGNIMLRTYQAAYIDMGYNRRQWIDNLSMTHNTLVQSTTGSDISPTGAYSFGDSYDNAGPNLGTNLTFSSNILFGNYNNVIRAPDTATWLSRLHFSQDDYNNVNGATSANFTGFNRFATFTIAGVEYNTYASRNLLGISLFDPLYSAGFSSKALTLTYTSATSISLTWDGGTAVPLILYSGTSTGSNTSSTLKDTSKAFPTAQNSTTTPIGCFVKINSGTGVGQVARVTNTTATSLTVAPPWTTTPDATSTYSIVKSEIQLFDSGGTNYVRAGVDLRSLPTTTLTDSGIGLALHGVSVNPNFVDSTRNLASWSTAQGGAGTEADSFSRLMATPSLAYSSLLPYIQGGFSPTNQALKGAAADGGDIGAVAVQVTGIIHRITTLGVG